MHIFDRIAEQMSQRDNTVLLGEDEVKEILKDLNKQHSISFIQEGDVYKAIMKLPCDREILGLQPIEVKKKSYLKVVKIY